LWTSVISSAKGNGNGNDNGIGVGAKQHEYLNVELPFIDSLDQVMWPTLSNVEWGMRNGE